MQTPTPTLTHTSVARQCLEELLIALTEENPNMTKAHIMKAILEAFDKYTLI